MGLSASEMAQQAERQGLAPLDYNLELRKVLIKQRNGQLDMAAHNEATLAVANRNVELLNTQLLIANKHIEEQVGKVHECTRIIDDQGKMLAETRELLAAKKNELEAVDKEYKEDTEKFEKQLLEVSEELLIERNKVENLQQRNAELAETIKDLKAKAKQPKT